MRRNILLFSAIAMVVALVGAVPALAQVAFEIGDTENESGGIGTSNEFEIAGNNNSACLGQEQFGNSGNFTNQQGALQYASVVDDLGFAGPGIGFAPENETGCEQAVQQAAAASSGLPK